MAWKVAHLVLLAPFVLPVLGTCRGHDLAQVLVSKVGSCKDLSFKEEQMRDVDCAVAGDSTAESICMLLFKMRSHCAVEKFWVPLGELVNCLKAEHPEDISELYPIMDQIGDLPVNDKVEGAIKAFMNQMLAHMFSPGTNLLEKSWTQQAFCEARLALTYRYEYEEHLGSLSALNQVCKPTASPLRLFSTNNLREWRSSLSSSPGLIFFAIVATLAALAMLLKVRRREIMESESELEGLEGLEGLMDISER